MTLDELRSGGKMALASILNRLEQDGDGPWAGLLDQAWRHSRARTVGITGPPGAGKSTLIDALVRHWREKGLTVGCIAVDPSSAASGGALLGDRVRLNTDPADQGLFFRSMAAKEQLGGLADATVAAVALMGAVFDLVLVETVGVGQSEIQVAWVADTILLCLQPGWGDTVQFMKAGIAEIPHVIAVTKTDLGHGAAPVRAAFPHVPVLAVSARLGVGVDGLADSLDQHAATLDRTIVRQAQAAAWVKAAIRDRFGRHGLKRADLTGFSPGISPFKGLAQITDALKAAYGS